MKKILVIPLLISTLLLLVACDNNKKVEIPEEPSVVTPTEKPTPPNPTTPDEDEEPIIEIEYTAPVIVSNNVEHIIGISELLVSPFCGLTITDTETGIKIENDGTVFIQDDKEVVVEEERITVKLDNIIYLEVELAGNNVVWNEEGEYEVLYKVTNRHGFITIHIRTITIKLPESPEITIPTITITVKNITIIETESYDFKFGVTAHDETDGDLTSLIIIDSSSCNLNTPGSYVIKYSITNSFNQTCEDTLILIVKTAESPTLTIEKNNITVGISSSINLLSGVAAYDPYDGDVTSKVSIVSNNLDINILGTYKVQFSITNKYGKTSLKTLTITTVFEDAVTAFMYAEQKLMSYENYEITATGETVANKGNNLSETKLSVISRKIKVGNQQYYLNTGNTTKSPALAFNKDIADSAVEIFYDNSTFTTRKFTKVDNNFNPSNQKDHLTLNMENYASTFAVLPSRFNYLVNDNTVTSVNDFSYSEKYSFVVNLDIDLATVNYKKMISQSNPVSDLTKPPKFEYAKLTVEIDSYGNFIKMSYDEKYVVYTTVSIAKEAPTISTVVETFRYDNDGSNRIVISPLAGLL